MASVMLAGQPVASVSTSSFKGEFRGKPVRILSATRNLGPRRIVVLLDASGSMVGLTKGKWDLVLRAAGDVAAHAPPDSSVALLVFNDKVKQEVDFSAGIRLFVFLVEDYPGLRRVPEESGPLNFLQLVQATGGRTVQLSARWSEPRYPVEDGDRVDL